MDIGTLLHELTLRGFTLGGGCIPNELNVTGPVHKLSDNLRHAIAQHKQALLAMVEPQADAHALEERQAIIDADGNMPAAAEALEDVGGWFNCRTHLDRSDWHDTPHETRAGWITTHCRRCGKWLGHRPEEKEKASQSRNRSNNINQAAIGAGNTDDDSNR